MAARRVNYQGTEILERVFVVRYQLENSPHSARRMPESVDSRLIINLRDISHTMRRLYEGKGSQKRVLMLLREAGTITQRELTARLGIQSGSASEVIAKLEHMGLIARVLSEEDRRTADISLTEEGRRQADEALEHRQQRHEEMFSALSSEEKAQLLSMLEKINVDWERRYRGTREHRRSHDHKHDRRPKGEGGCNRDCEHCSHPCSRYQDKQAE